MKNEDCPLKAIDGLEGLDEGVLREIRGIFTIRSHVINDPINALAVAYNELIKCANFPLLNALHNRPINIRFLLAL